MEAVTAVHYVNSAVLREGLPGRIYGAAPQKTVKRNAILLYALDNWRYYKL